MRRATPIDDLVLREQSKEMAGSVYFAAQCDAKALRDLLNRINPISYPDIVGSELMSQCYMVASLRYWTLFNAILHAYLHIHGPGDQVDVDPQRRFFKRLYLDGIISAAIQQGRGN